VNRPSHLWLLAASAALTLARTAHAQAPTPAAPSDTATLRPVVVTATRVPVASGRSPATVTVLEGAALRERGITRVSEALRDVPGVDVVQSGGVGGTTSLFVRGGNSNYVKVLVDGVPVNAPGGAFDFANLTTENVERIEVLRGPASVLYGSDAVAGVVQIFTRSGQGPTRARAEARGGTFGTREGAVEVGGGTRRAGYTVSGATASTDGFLPFNNDYRNDGLSGQLRVAPDSRSDARLSARYTDATFHYPTNAAGSVEDSNAVRDEQRLVVSMDAGRRITERLEARLLAGTTELDASSDNQPDSPGDSTGFYTRDDTDLYRRTADLRVNYTAGLLATVTAGTEFQRQQVATRGVSRFGSFPPARDSTRRHRLNQAYYGQVLGLLTPALSYTVGARLDDNSQFGTFPTARASVGYQFATGTRLRVAGGNAFKEPAFDEIFATTFTKASPDLLPERTRSWEVGIEQSTVGDRLLLSATYFDQRFRNLIQYVAPTAPDDFLGSYENLAAANASGLELQGRVLAPAGLSVTASYTALRTRVTEAGTGAFGTFAKGERLLRRPPHSARLNVGYRAPDRLVLDANVGYVGARDDRDFASETRARLDPYVKLDLAGEYTVVRPSPSAPAVALTARVDNATGEDYQPVFGFVAPGRTVLLGVRVGAGR